MTGRADPTPPGAPARRSRALPAPPPALLAGCAALLATGLLYLRFESDDAHILLAFAWHWGPGSPPCLNPGQPVHAITAPLWFGVAVLARLFGEPEAAAVGLRAASGACAFACVVLVLALTRRLGGGTAARATALVLLLADPWFGRWAFSGLEAPAAGALSLACLRLRCSTRGTARVAAPLLALGLGPMLRPELAVLGALLGAELLLADRAGLVRAGRKKLASMALLAALPACAWCWLAWSWWGTVLPQSAVVKAGTMSGPAVVLRAAQVVLSGQAAALALLVAGALAARPGSTDAAPADAVARPEPPPVPGTGKTMAALALCWTALLVVLYAVRGYEPLSRYLLPGTVCLPVAAALASSRIDRRWPLAAGLAAIVLGALVTWTRVVPASSGATCRFYRDAAAWMDLHAQPGDAVASWEVGTLALFGHHQVVDVAGLVLPEDLLPLRGTQELLAATRPRYSLVRPDLPDAALRPVLERTVRRSDVAAGRSPATLVLWEIAWPLAPSGPVRSDPGP